MHAKSTLFIPVLYSIVRKAWWNMDALKQKYGNESPDDRKKRKKSLVVPNIGTLAICIAMLAVGIQYNDEEECKGKVR